MLGGRQWSLVDLLAAALRDALALTALAGDLHARRLVRLRVEQHHVRDVDRARLVRHAADLAGTLGVADRARPLVPGRQVEAVDDHAVALRLDGEHGAGLALFLAGHDLAGVALADLDAGHVVTEPPGGGLAKQAAMLAR